VCEERANSAAVGSGSGNSLPFADVTTTIVVAGWSAADIVQVRFSQCDAAVRFIGQLALQQQLFRDGNAESGAIVSNMITIAAIARRIDRCYHCTQ
jgi:hypothetical protein